MTLCEREELLACCGWKECKILPDMMCRRLKACAAKREMNTQWNGKYLDPEKVLSIKEYCKDPYWVLDCLSMFVLIGNENIIFLFVSLIMNYIFINDHCH